MSDETLLAEPAETTLTINAPVDLINKVLAVFGVPMPDASALTEVRLLVCHSQLLNSSEPALNPHSGDH